VASLLAVDLGVRTGLAAYGDDGRLRWYARRTSGRRAACGRRAGLLDAEPDLARVVIEGGGALERIWRAEAESRAVARAA
jgi:hypothetical protein